MGDVTATTVTVGVIGDPIRHSLSPTLHNAAFAALGVDACSMAFEVADGQAGAAVAAMRSLGIRGLSVTLPHKEAVLDAVDEVSPEAAALGAANCLANTGGHVVAHNTDGDGFVRGLQDQFDLDLGSLRIGVLGAGGAARAVIDALGRSGVEQIIVVNRTEARAARAAALGGPQARPGSVEDLADCGLVVNATSLGMHDNDPLPCDPDVFSDQMTAIDLIYRQHRTPWLVEAEQRGAQIANGVAMLLHQAAVQIELWVDRPAPIDEMRRCVSAEM